MQRGGEVVINGRSESKLDAAREDTGIGLVDVRMDVLINNAGVLREVSYVAGEASVEDQLSELDIDFGGPLRIVNAFLPRLAERSEAAIVNVSSAFAFVPMASAPIYCAAKAATHSWTRSLRYQLAGSGITVVELMPPLVETPMVTAYEAPKMTAEQLAMNFVRGFEKGKLEITPGQASSLRAMSKWAPNFIFRALNKQFA